MSKTCLVCDTIHLEMIGILRHPKKLDSMLDCLLGLQAQQDDYLCNKCCNDVINAFESKHKLHQLGLFESKVVRGDVVDITNSYEDDQGDQSETSAFSTSKVQIEEEDVEDVNMDMNYEKMMTSALESIVKKHRGAVREYSPTAKGSVVAIAGGEHESSSTRLNKTMSSSSLFKEDFNIATLNSDCKQMDSGEHSKKHKSVNIDDTTTIEEKPNGEREDVLDTSFIYTRSKSRRKHIEIHNSYADKGPANKKRCVWCECEKSFITLSKLENHEKIHTGGKPYKCFQCARGFITLSKFKAHEKIHTSEKPYKCRECEKCFTTPFRLKIHEKNHTGERPYKCAQCEKNFIRPDALKEHEHTHTREKPHKCCECEKSFVNSYRLKIHARNHTGEKPYKCHQCKKIYTTSSELRIHEKNHTSEKPYKCHKCEKCFTTSFRLKTHGMGHTGERPHKCSQCEKSFIRADVLKEHEHTHTREKPHKCCVCEKSFVNSYRLKIHERFHIREKPYKCCQCEEGFTSSYLLKVHEKFHGEKPSSQLHLLNRQ